MRTDEPRAFGEMLRSVERDRWIALLLLIGLAALLVSAARHLGVGIPEFPASPARRATAALPLPVARVKDLFSVARVPRFDAETNLVTPFYTLHFQPPPSKPPTTRKVDLTYLGHIKTAAGEKRAYVRVGETLFIGPVTSNVVADLAVAEISLRTLVLTNRAAQTNVLEFKTLKQVEVPVL
jgi:hypothetical protein